MTALGFHTDRASTHLATFSLICAVSTGDRQRAATLRRRVFLARRGVALDEELEAARDEAALVFLLFERTTLVATARVSPYPSASSPLPADLCRDTGADSELSRIACVGTNALSGARYSVVLLTLGARHLLTYTEHRTYVAYAHPKLCAQHGRLGAVDTGGRCIVPERDEPYHLLTGSYVDTLCNGSALLGIDDLRRSA
jgi:hypothetical protein